MFGNLGAFINPLKAPSPRRSRHNVRSPVSPVLSSPAPDSPAPLPGTVYTVAGVGATMFKVPISENTPLVLLISPCSYVSVTQTLTMSNLQLNPIIRLNAYTQVPQSELVRAALASDVKWCECEEGLLISYPFDAYRQYIAATDPDMYDLMTESGFQTSITLG